MKLTGEWISWILDLPEPVPPVFVVPVLSPGATAPCSYWARPRPCIGLTLPLFWTLPQPLQREHLVRELAQHALYAVYDIRPSRFNRWTAAWQEARGRHLQLHAMVSDIELWYAALRGDQMAWELADRFGRTEQYCRERVNLFFFDHPELLPVLCPREPETLDDVPF